MYISVTSVTSVTIIVSMSRRKVGVNATVYFGHDWDDGGIALT